jgi:hypothetical protein
MTISCQAAFITMRVSKFSICGLKLRFISYSFEFGEGVVSRRGCMSRVTVARLIRFYVGKKSEKPGALWLSAQKDRRKMNALFDCGPNDSMGNRPRNAE